ncbi:hypothetical protein EJB05_39575 [Eragrostis curvula]|uniref:RRM domain-containing protein n=1 Tax=Eragrostis curvula TaxID=38414 RepID=A0A5J9TYU1_9POAL|nr:hypothetical protein EJB05_39575 [Eragrostis curvula]
MTIEVSEIRIGLSGFLFRRGKKLPFGVPPPPAMASAHAAFAPTVAACRGIGVSLSAYRSSASSPSRTLHPAASSGGVRNRQLLQTSTACARPPSASQIAATRLYVSGLAFRTTEESLRNAFEKFGELTEVHIVMDKLAKRPRGFAFLSYADEEEAKAAMEGMHGKTDTCRDLVGELEDLGSRCYDNPPRVEPRDLGSALLRLARRCRDALRCASCTSTTDVQPRARQRSPPLSTPASAPSSSRFHAGDSSSGLPVVPPFMPTPGWSTGPPVQFAAPDYSLHSVSGSLVHGSSYGQPDVQGFSQMPEAPPPTQPTQQFPSTPLEAPRVRQAPDPLTYPTDQIRRGRKGQGKRAEAEPSKRRRGG